MQIEIVTLSGTEREMGRQHGEAFAAGVQTMCEIRRRLILDRTPQHTQQSLLALTEEPLAMLQAMLPEVYEEFAGIAEGAGVSESELFVGNGYTDVVDLAASSNPRPEECTCFGVTGKASCDGKSYVGQTWDMHDSALDYVVAFERRPATGPRTVTLTTTGCLSLIGMNEAGVAVGNNNLVPVDARPGLMYLSLIHGALAQRDSAAALELICQAERMSGHHYYLGGAEGDVRAVETTGRRHAELGPDGRGVYAHANHYVAPELIGLQMARSLAGSRTREDQMRALLTEAAGDLEAEGLMKLLADHEAPICRHPQGDGSTCGAVIMSPQERRMWLLKGRPCEGGFVEVSL